MKEVLASGTFKPSRKGVGKGSELKISLDL
jgi:hypothetical protein